MPWRNQFLLKYATKLLALGCGSGALALALAEGALLFATMLPHPYVPPNLWCAGAFGFGLGMLLAPADVWLKRSLPITWRYCLTGSVFTAITAVLVGVFLLYFDGKSTVLDANAMLVSPWMLGAVGGVIGCCGQWLKRRMQFSRLIACAECVYGAVLSLGITQLLMLLGFSAPHFNWMGMVFLSLWGALWCFGRFWPPYAFAHSWLRQLNGQGKGMMHPLWRPLWGEYVLQIGSDVKNTIVLRDSMGVFPFHASLFMQSDKRVLIRDQQHNALVLVNFRRIPERCLDPGDLLKIGEISLQYGERKQPLLQGAGKKHSSEERKGARPRRPTSSRYLKNPYRVVVPLMVSGMVCLFWVGYSLLFPEVAFAQWDTLSWPSAVQWFSMMPWGLRLVVASMIGAVSVWWAQCRLEATPKNSLFEVIAPDGKRENLALPQEAHKRARALDLRSVLRPLMRYKNLRISPNLERVHLTWRKNGWLLEDSNPRNALLANRRRVRKTMLRDGNVLDIGNVTLYHHHPKFIDREEAPLATPADGQVLKFQPPSGPLMVDTPMLTHVQNPKQVFYITKNLIFIGRSETNDLVIKSQQVQLRQAKIERVGKRWHMVDLSENGNTMLNNRRIEERCLCVGDEISIEGFRFHFDSVTKSMRMRLAHRISRENRSDNRVLPFQQKQGIPVNPPTKKVEPANKAYHEAALDTLVMEQGGMEETGHPGWVKPGDRERYVRNQRNKERNEAGKTGKDG